MQRCWTSQEQTNKGSCNESEQDEQNDSWYIHEMLLSASKRVNVVFVQGTVIPDKQRENQCAGGGIQD
ncbi:hypothetical protein KSF_045290 [Reticulibacter mediterranei]|uniref:Uncharacterized protein n=1 Tax=Reticulibacter mediterranei TaxID=2778369 RepID=A0A8J3IH69_9CHLR|nr:hypothetical protein KSF_045290 [Reticulibacter mediterranei]